MNEISMRPVAPAGLSAFDSPKVQGPGGSGFADLLGQALSSVSSRQQEADRLIQGLAAGEHANIHETMIAMEQSGISFRMMTKVQQKALDAYREVMRMQL